MIVLMYTFSYSFIMFCLARIVVYNSRNKTNELFDVFTLGIMPSAFLGVKLTNGLDGLDRLTTVNKYMCRTYGSEIKRQKEQ